MATDLDMNSVTVTSLGTPSTLDIGTVTVTSLGIPNEKREEAHNVSPNSESFVMIDTYWIDVTLQEDHSFTNEITEYPVESGGSISDNIRPKPIEVTMEGIVSNTPVEPALVTRNNAYGKKSAEFAYAILLSVWNRRDTVTIRTSLATFTNMGLESLTIPRSSGEPDALRFTAKFKQVKTVTNAKTSTTNTRTSTPICKSKKKVAKAATPQTFMADGLYINKRKGIWFDPHINSWRYKAWYRNTTGVQDVLNNDYEGPSEYAWSVIRGRPLWITANEWETLFDLHHAGNDDPQVRALLKSHFAKYPNEQGTATEVVSGATGFGASIRGAWADIIFVPKRYIEGYFSVAGQGTFYMGNVE